MADRNMAVAMWRRMKMINISMALLWRIVMAAYRLNIRQLGWRNGIISQLAGGGVIEILKINHGTGMARRKPESQLS
jgi:hypothetical protein